MGAVGDSACGVGPPALPGDPIDILAASPEALSESDLAARFTARGPWRTRLGNILEMLVTLGRARQDGDRYRAIGG